MKPLYGLICMALCSIFTSSAMNKHDAIVSMTPKTLVAASKELDKAYEWREQRKIFGIYYDDTDIEDVCEKRKEYKKLVQENEVAVVWPTEQDGVKINLSNQGLKTVAYLIVPAHIPADLITELDVSSNHLTDVRLGLLVKKLPFLKKLIAANNDISHMSVIGHCCGDNTLEFLDVQHNTLTEVNLTDILITFPHLKAIDLSYNKIGYVTIDHKCLSADLSKVKIKLHNNKLDANNISDIKYHYMELIKKRLLKEQILSTLAAVSWGAGMGWWVTMNWLHASNPMLGLVLCVPMGLGNCIIAESVNNKTLRSLAEFKQIQFVEEWQPEQ